MALLKRGLGQLMTVWSRHDIDALYRRAGYAVYNRARRLLRNDAEAREVTQEVFASLLERPGAFQGQSSELGYLYGSVTQLALMRLRSRMHRGSDWEGEVARTIEESAVSMTPEERVEAKRALQEVLRDEDPRTLEMVQYHYVDGLSQETVARLMGLSRVTVNQRLMALRERARNKECAP